MLIIICLFLLISFFEIRKLIRAKEKKEAALYIILGSLAVLLGAYVMFSPGYMSFARTMLNLFGIKQ